jgi:hypothetical protein
LVLLQWSKTKRRQSVDSFEVVGRYGSCFCWRLLRDAVYLRNRDKDHIVGKRESFLIRNCQMGDVLETPR